MNAVIDAAISRYRTVLSILVLLLVTGTYSYLTIPKEAQPDVDIPIIYVSMHLTGIAPEDSESLLVRPMEEEMRGIAGVKEMRSTAYEGGGFVLLEFDAGFDADQALADVREAVDRVKPDLPSEADEPTVHEVNVSLFPAVVVTLSGDVPERTLFRLARTLRDDIRGLPPVLSAEMIGDREEAVEIIVDPLLIESYGLNGNDILNMVSRSNRLIAAGHLDPGQGRFSVNVPGLFQTVDDILDMPISVRGDAVVRFRDVAEIRRTYRDAEGYARVDGQPAVAIEVSKRVGENVIDTIAAVRAVVAERQADWPDSLQVTFSQDTSEDIRLMLTDLQNNVISAILLVMIVVIGALSLRTGLLVGIAIPGSFLTGILVLAVFGLTVNIVVLFSLILAVGMLVDGAIVVTEYADRKMTEGMPRRRAYAMAAKRMAWPITASTATTLAAFMPLLFWPGVVGEFMKFLPITLIATLSASLLMALIFVPTLGSLIGKPGTADPERMKALAAGETGDLTQVGGLTGRYLKLLQLALRHPAKVLMTTLALLIGVWGYFATHGTGVIFFPDVEPETVIVLVHARGNLSVEEKDALVREVEERILVLRDEFESVYTRSGPPGQGSDVAEDVIGQISIELRDWQVRRPSRDILTDIRQRTAGLAGIIVETREPDAGPPVGKPVQIQLTSRFPELLPDAIALIRTYMDEEMEGLVDIEDSRALPGIDWELTVDRAQAAKYGLDVTAVGDSVKLVTTGLNIGTYRPGDADDEIDILVRYPAENRSLDELDRIRIATSDGNIPISNFVERRPVAQTGSLSRVDARRAMEVKADVAPGVLADTMVQQLRAFIDSADLDPRITVEFRGEDEEQQAAGAFLGQAFGIALFVMAIILVTQFNSFYSAGLILSAVIMSTIGVLIGLLVTGQPFSIVMTGVGVIALAGIVVNNNIVLIDTYDRLKTGTSPEEAILRTGAQRLRPVMLTTVTTVLGLLPMALSMNIDFVNRDVTIGAPSTQWWVNLATAVVFGLSFSSILTLIVTPSALMVRANVAAWRQRRRAIKAAKDQGKGLHLPGYAGS